MKTVNFVFDVPNIDAFDLSRANPGVGGTHYACLVIAQLLARRYTVVLHTRRAINLPGVQIAPRTDLAKTVTGADTVVYPVSAWDDDLANLPGHHIAWLHNIRDHRLDHVSKKAQDIILVGNQHFDALRWHRGVSKFRVIFNPFDPNLFSYSPSPDKHIVYLGALNEAKGFQHYARAIGPTLRKYDTQLKVIGGSATYGIAPDGRLGVADEAFESTFFDSVKEFVHSGHIVFLGNLGLEKEPIVSQARLALINPTGRSETFGYSGLECMAAGVPTMGGYHYGLIDTLYPDEALLLHKTSDIERKISILLDRQEVLLALRPKVRRHAEQWGNFSAVLDQWVDVIEGRGHRKQPPTRPYLADGKPLSIALDYAGVHLDFSSAERLKALVGRVCPLSAARRAASASFRKKD